MSRKKEFTVIDEFLEWYKSIRPETVYLIENKSRHDEAMQAIKDISRFALDSNPEGTKISANPDELTGSSICFEVITNLVVFEDMKEFCDAVSKANTMDIHARTDGKVSISFTFQNVYLPAEPSK